MATQITGFFSATTVAKTPPPQIDPKVEAARILNDTRIGNGANTAHRVDSIEARLDMIAKTDPALAGLVRAEVVKGLSVTDQAALLRNEQSVAGVGSLSGGEQHRGQTKPIPACMEAFLNRAHPGFDYSKVELVNGLPPGFDITDNNVTFGNTIYLDPEVYADVGLRTSATATVFHEVTHARDYAEGRLSVGGYIVDAVRYGSHDSIPSEIRANAFMNQAMAEFRSSPEVKMCSR